MPESTAAPTLSVTAWMTVTRTLACARATRGGRSGSVEVIAAAIRVTIVENAKNVRKGGMPIDLRRDTMAIADRLGLIDAVRAKALPTRMTEFADIDGAPIARREPDSAAENIVIDDYEIHRHDDVEIHRDDLLAILFGALDDGVQVRFDDSIISLTETADGVRAAFRNGPEEDFAMVLGCDGSHSTVRRLWFGPESEYSTFLHNDMSVTVVDGTFIPSWTTRIQNTPGRTLLNGCLMWDRYLWLDYRTSPSGHLRLLDRAGHITQRRHLTPTLHPGWFDRRITRGPVTSRMNTIRASIP